jgi:hypothetical protein
LRPSALNASDPVFPATVAYAAPYIVAAAVGTMPNPSIITINIAQGARLEGGEKFSVPGGRGHKVVRVLSRSGQQATVHIEPPAHITIPADTPLNFDWPIIRARAATGQDLAPNMTFGRADPVSITFVEDFDYAE